MYVFELKSEPNQKYLLLLFTFAYLAFDLCLKSLLLILTSPVSLPCITFHRYPAIKESSNSTITTFISTFAFFNDMISSLISLSIFSSSLSTARICSMSSSRSKRVMNYDSALTKFVNPSPLEILSSAYFTLQSTLLILYIFVKDDWFRS